MTNAILLNSAQEPGEMPWDCEQIPAADRSAFCGDVEPQTQDPGYPKVSALPQL